MLTRFMGLLFVWSIPNFIFIDLSYCCVGLAVHYGGIIWVRAHIAPPPNFVIIWMVMLEGNLVLIMLQIHLHQPPQEVQVGACAKHGAHLHHRSRKLHLAEDPGPKLDIYEDVCSNTSKWIEWDGRHNSTQPSLVWFVCGTTRWKLVLAGCMNVVGFKPRDADQK